jgi:hypothetical protein
VDEEKETPEVEALVVETPAAPKEVRFVGGDAYLPGVPAVDMSREDWEALDADLRANALQLELYEVTYQVEDQVEAPVEAPVEPRRTKRQAAPAEEIQDGI